MRIIKATSGVDAQKSAFWLTIHYTVVGNGCKSKVDFNDDLNSLVDLMTIRISLFFNLSTLKFPISLDPLNKCRLRKN